MVAKTLRMKNGSSARKMARNTLSIEVRPAVLSDARPPSDCTTWWSRPNLFSVGVEDRLVLGGDQGRASAPERIEDDPIAVGTIPNRVGHERDRLDRRVHRQLAFGCAIEDILAVIFPDVRSIPTEAAELDIVDMWRGPLLEHEYEFVPRPVE